MATLPRATHSLTGRIRQPVRVLALLVPGVFLVLHGLAHSVGFFVHWDLSHPTGFTYSTTLLGGRVDLGEIGIRIDGLLWLVAAVGFVVLGLRLSGFRRLEPIPVAAVAIFSLVLCALDLPGAAIGMVIDVLILAVTAIIFKTGPRHAD
jgi:hypothetical protein